MPKEMKSYTDGYRREAVEYALASGKPNSQTADELGINRKTFNNWVLRHKKKQGGSSSLETAQDSPEIRELKRRNKELEMENAFLKKQQPSSQKTKRKRQVFAHACGEGKLPRQAYGKSAESVALWVLRLAQPQTPR